MMKRILIFTILVLTLSLNVKATDNKEYWVNANNYYSQTNYKGALDLYLKIEESGFISEELYFNIGNSYFKLKENSKAILYYERALKLNPSDKDAKNNLELTKEYCIDKIDVVPEFILNTWLKQINYSLSSNMWSYIGILFIVFMSILLILFKYTSKRKVKKLAFIATVLSVSIVAISFLFAWKQKQNYSIRNSAIVMKPVAPIKSTPDNSGKDLFILHEGAKVKIIEEVGQWKRVELSDGRQGWVSIIDIEVI